jgi:drug/metabolite transporter (DMT)-like permease
MNSPGPRAWAIHLKLIVATIFWALTPIFGRLLANYSAPYALACGRFLVATVALAAVVYAGEARPALKPRDVLAFSLLGLTGVCLHNVLVFMGVEYTEANRANVIFATITIMIAIIDMVFAARRFHAGALLGIGLGVVGTAVVVTDGALGELLRGALGRGEALILASAASWALYSVLGRPLLERYSPLVVTYYASLYGTVMLLPFVALDAHALPQLVQDPRAAGMLLFLGIFNSAIGFLWYYQAVQRIGAVTTSAYINLVPLFGVLLSAILLGEVPSRGLLAGGMLIIGALLLINRYER